MFRRSAFWVAAVLVLGILGSGVAALVAADRQDQRRVEALEDIADQVSVQAANKLEEAFLTGDRMKQVSESEWRTQSEYQSLWNVYSQSLAGDAAAVLSVAVTAEDLNDFVAAEQELDADFEITLQNPNPSRGHIILARSVDERAAVGGDFSFLPPIVDQFLAIGVDDTLFVGRDIRRPMPGDYGQLQVNYGHMVQVDGKTTRAWTTIQIDLRATLDAIAADIDPAYGVTFSVEAIQSDETFGLDLADATLSAAPRSQRVRDIEIVANVWTNGDDANISSPQRVGLVGLALTAFLALAVFFALKVADLQRLAVVNGRQARRDDLTGLPNRRWMLEHLDGLAESPTAVLFCDIDRFKKVNDSEGHEAGDQLLTAVASRITAILPPNVTLARFGGDEFVACVSCASDEQLTIEAEEVASSISEVMRRPFEIGERSHRTSMSIGIGESTASKPASTKELIRTADIALGHGKRSGLEVVVYDDAFRVAELDQLRMEEKLHESLDNGALDVYYQPIIDAESRIVSFEALVRWELDGQIISPAMFLPVAGEIGRMPDLGRVVLAKALADFVAESDRPQHCTLHVNVDASLLQDPALPSFVQSQLSLNGLAADRLILEIVEDEWVNSIDGIEANLSALAKIGINVAIDDFGSGHSSLGRLFEVPNIAEIKLDMSLVRRLHDPRSLAFVEGLNEIAVRLGIALVAEGIETENDFLAAKNAGIPYFQGYLFARPAPDFTELDDLEWRPTHLNQKATGPQTRHEEVPNRVSQ